MSQVDETYLPLSAHLYLSQSTQPPSVTDSSTYLFAFYFRDTCNATTAYGFLANPRTKPKWRKTEGRWSSATEPSTLTTAGEEE